MRICLISPGHLSTNPRILKEATALTGAGYEVRVICGRYSRWGTEHDITLADPAWQVRQVAFGPVEAAMPRYLRQSVQRKLFRSLVHGGLRSIPMAEAACHPAAMDLIAEALRVPADLYVAHYVAALPAAARAAARHNAVYAFDAEDFHLGDLPDEPEHAIEKLVIRAIESRYLPRAAYVTAASPMIADAYAATYGIPRPSVVLNVFPRANAPSAPTPRGDMEAGPSLYWFSQTIGPGRGLETAIEAIAQAESRPHLYLRGRPAEGFEGTLRRLAHMAGVAGRLHFLPPAAPDDLERLGAVYDLGYSGETGYSRNNSYALGNKFFSYLVGGVPIIASNTPAHRVISPELGPAIALFETGSAGSLAAGVDHLLLNPERLAAARRHAWDLGQTRFNWEVEQAAFLAQIRRVLRQGDPGARLGEAEDRVSSMHASNVPG